MRYHHGYGCHGGGGCYGGCGDLYWGSRTGYWDEPTPYPRRPRLGGASAARLSRASQLEAYLADLRDEMRAVEEDLAGIRSGEGQTRGTPD